MERKVKIFEWAEARDDDGNRLLNKYGSKYLDRTKTAVGLFHQFGCDYEEFETGPGNYSTAIVEMEDGTIKNIPVQDVEFIK